MDVALYVEIFMKYLSIRISNAPILY